MSKRHISQHLECLGEICSNGISSTDNNFLPSFVIRISRWVSNTALQADDLTTIEQYLKEAVREADNASDAGNGVRM
jgi:hypothetical protein